MTRSPLTYPLNRLDTDGGGAADLQTDVMRFMAILSLCLVAIFALVQSIPLTPPMPQSPAPIRLPQLKKPTAPPSTLEAEKTTELPRPDAARPPPEEARPEAPEPRALRLPAAAAYRPAPNPQPADPVPLAPAAASVPDAAPTPREPVDEGFTLRFESDLALRRLVARNDVGLYAIQPNKALRMNVNRGSMNFWPASLPGQFHEMDETTVPDDVIRALRRSGTAGAVKWGVTLPSRLSRELNRYLNEQSGGALIIGGDGVLRLED